MKPMKPMKHHVPATSDQRISTILKYISHDSKVLDIGCAHHHAERQSDPFWLHQHIKARAKNTVGLELESEECEKLRNMGYNVVCGNIEDNELADMLGRDHDVIVAGELIEHLSNPGLFLENSYEMLKQGGQLIITTPNPWNFFNIISVVLRNKIPIHEQHTAWFDDKTLIQLVTRFGFKVQLFEYLHWMHGQKGEFISKTLYKLKFKRFAGAGILVVLKK